MNFGEKQRNTQEDIRNPENFKQETAETFESEQDVIKLGEKRISDLGQQEAELKQGWRGRAESFNKAVGLSSEKLNSLKEKFGLDEKLANISEKGSAYLGEAKTKIVEVAKTREFDQIADATPFVGGAKRVAESVYGKTLSGDELSGMNRLKHGAKGAIDLGLDFTGVGEVEKGAKMAYVGKKIASGIKDNPEAFASLGKKVVQGKEKIANGSKDAELEADFLKNPDDEQWKKDVLKGLVPEKQKTIETEIDDFNKWQKEQKENNKTPDEIRDEITKRTLKGENVGDIFKDISKNNPKPESDDDFQKPSDKMESLTKQKKDHRYTIEKQIPFDVESILPHNKLNNNENNMKFGEAPAAQKDSQAEKSKAEALAESGKNFSKDNNEEAVMKRMKAMREINEKYQKEHPQLAVERGTLARKTELENIVSDLRARVGKVEGGFNENESATREELLDSLNKAETARKENEEILNAKLGFMDTTDVERIFNMDERKKQIGQEKQSNDAIIYGSDNEDMNAKSEAARRNIGLEKEEGGLYIEKEQMVNEKYKGLGGI